ncbi:MAG: hypothetical protein J6V05_02550 [Alistipes sp.]|jgi:hypothetical protein|nr:hypothetical protein [Alistipes sp.]
MFKNIAYFWLTIALLFVQIFILDEVSIAMTIRPMIFPLVILLIPIEWRTIWVVIATLLLGLFMDLSLGGAGLYTATLLPLAVMRRWILFLTTRRSIEAGDQSSLLSRMPMRQVMIYVGAMLLLHHTMFFALESLSAIGKMQLIATILLSTLLSLLLVWPVVRLFLKRVVR